MDEEPRPERELPVPLSQHYVPAEAMTAVAAVEGLPYRPGKRGVSRERRYVPTKPTEPWERQPGEPPRMYRAFCLFRDMPEEERKVATVAREMHLVQRNVFAWSTTWKWHERVAAWDQELDRTATRKAMQAARKMQERHINIAMRMQQAVAERLMDPDRPVQLSNRDIDRWLEKAVRIERAARGMNDGPRVAINVNQQQGQAQQANSQASAVNDTQRTIAEMIAADPSLLQLMNGEIDQLLEAVEGYSTGNEPDQVVPGD